MTPVTWGHRKLFGIWWHVSIVGRGQDLVIYVNGADTRRN